MHTAVYYDTLCMHLLIGAKQVIRLVVMEIAVAPLKIKVDILEVEATEVNISVQLFVIATSVARLEYAYLIWHMCIAVYCYLCILYYHVTITHDTTYR